MIELVRSGGSVMIVLLLLSFIIWALIFDFYYSQSINGRLYKNAKSILSLIPAQNKEQVLTTFKKVVRTRKKLLHSFIAVAPLLGLLGTVGGMIETFSSLQTSEMFKPSGGISEGISQALLTTQLGLIVSVPPLLLLKYLESKVDKNFDRLKGLTL